MSAVVPRLLNTNDAWVDVRTYGARGDGTTDDTAALLDAASAARSRGRALYLPVGTYLYNETLDFRRTGYGGADWSGLHVIGESGSEDWVSGVSPLSTLLWNGDAADPMMRVTRGNRVEGLHFRAKAGEATVAGLDWDKGGSSEAGTRIHVERCAFWGDYGGAGALSGSMDYGIAIGRSGATNNLEFGTFRNIWAFWQAVSCVAILSSTGQSKGHEFQNMQVGDAPAGLQVNKGSFNWNGGGMQGCVIGIEVIGDGFVDFCQVRDLNCERCGQILVRGATTASAPFLISGGRYSMVTDGMVTYPTSGAQIYWGSPGLLTIENTVWEDAGAGTEFRIYYAHGAEGGGVATRNNLFLNATPVITGFVECAWSSTNDRYLVSTTRTEIHSGRYRVTTTGVYDLDIPAGQLSPGSRSLGDGQWHIQYQELDLTGTQELILDGDAEYIITDL